MKRSRSIRYSAEEAVAIIVQESQDNFYIHLMVVMMIFLWVVGQTSNLKLSGSIPNQTQLMKTNWSKTLLELAQYRSGEEDAGQEEA